MFCSECVNSPTVCGKGNEINKLHSDLLYFNHDPCCIQLSGLALIFIPLSTAHTSQIKAPSTKFLLVSLGVKLDLLKQQLDTAMKEISGILHQKMLKNITKKPMTTPKVLRAVSSQRYVLPRFSVFIHMFRWQSPSGLVEETGQYSEGHGGASKS